MTPRIRTKKTLFLIAVLFLLSACATPQTAVTTINTGTQTYPPAQTPVPNPANIVYISQLKEKASSWVSDYTTFDTFHQKAVNYRKLFITKFWREEMIKTLDKLETDSEELKNIQTVPPDMQKANVYLIQSSDETKLMIQAYRQMLEQNQTTIPDEINTHSEKAISYIGLALKEVEPYFAP